MARFEVVGEVTPLPPLQVWEGLEENTGNPQTIVLRLTTDALYFGAERFIAGFSGPLWLAWVAERLAENSVSWADDVRRSNREIFEDNEYLTALPECVVLSCACHAMHLEHQAALIKRHERPFPEFEWEVHRLAFVRRRHQTSQLYNAIDHIVEVLRAVTR
jgi:hypothetical protein